MGYITMTLFTDTLLAVKDINLNKQQLEDYHKTLCELRGEMKMRMADVKKAKGLFMIQNPELSVAQRMINWKASELGQEESELVGKLGACSSNIESVKSRLYQIY